MRPLRAGPILADEWAGQAHDATVPTLAAHRLELAGWRTAPALLCPEHASSAPPAIGTGMGTAR